MDGAGGSSFPLEKGVHTAHCDKMSSVPAPETDCTVVFLRSSTLQASLEHTVHVHLHTKCNLTEGAK